MEEFHAYMEDKDWNREPTGALMIKTPTAHKHFVYRSKTGETNTVDRKPSISQNKLLYLL